MGQEKKISDWMINFTAKKSLAKVTSGSGSVGDRAFAGFCQYWPMKFVNLEKKKFDKPREEVKQKPQNECPN